MLLRGHSNPYEAFREALRLIIPHEWRRRAVRLYRSRFGWKRVTDWTAATILAADAAPPRPRRSGGDFYQSVTLLPHIPETEVSEILGQAMRPTQTGLPDIVCFSIVDWDFRFQRPQQLMAQYAAHGHRVFYLALNRYRTPQARPSFTVTTIQENLHEVQLAAREPLDVHENVLDEEAIELALGSLDELRRAENINEAIGYVMIPTWGQAAREARRRWGWRVIYDCMDEWENFPGMAPAMVEAEQRLVDDCDLLVVTAQRLADKWREKRRPMVLARNAADYDFYAAHCRPNPLLAKVEHPIIGYFGAIADWFDVELLVAVAGQRPQYNFVLLGGIFQVDVSALRDLPNVRLLGQQPYALMPEYLHHFDACIIPFKLNPITEATDPVKLYEYLSGGKPVVSVPLPELSEYAGVIYQAETPDEFARQLDAAVSENDPRLVEERKALARQHTWADRYRAIQESFVELTPRASIIIVTYHNLALTRLCLESVLRNTEYPNFEIVVVDNHSSDGTPAYLAEMARLHPHLRIVLNQANHGFARANNQGIELATGEYLILLNNDTVVPPGWLSRLLSHLDDPQVGMVGPVTNFVGNEARIDVTYRTWAEMEEFAIQQTWNHDRLAADIYMLAMFCVAFRREILEKVGPLDERFGIGMFEDDDYSLRIKQHGYRLICAADVFLHHFGRAAFGKLDQSGEYDRLFTENRNKFEEKWQVRWEPHKYAPLALTPHPRGK